MSNKITVILVSGKSQNGKDSLFIEAGKPLGFKRFAYADVLKDLVAKIYNFSHDQMYGSLKDFPDFRYPNKADPKYLSIPSWNLEKNELNNPRTMETYMEAGLAWLNPIYTEYLTPRRILQIFGQDQRKIYQDVWSSYLFNSEINKAIEQGYTKFMVTDLRFHDEVRVAKEWAEKEPKVDLLLFRVNRPGVVAKSGAEDISETQFDNYTEWNEVILNDGDLNHLGEIGRAAIQKYL